MSPSIFARLTRISRSFFFSICFSRRRKHPSSPELPTFSHPETDSLRSWQSDKQQFLRRPSLLKASTHEAQKKRHRASFPPPPEIYVEDWSSRGLNMSNFFETSPPTLGRSLAIESGLFPNHSSAPTTVPETKSEHLVDGSSSSSESLWSQPTTSSEDLENDASLSPPPRSQSSPSPKHPADRSSSPFQSSDVHMKLPTGLSDTSHSKRKTERRRQQYMDRNAGAQETAVIAQSSSPGRYTPSALSAVSGLLWDPPSFIIPHSTPLPGILSKSHPQSTLAFGQDSMAPYPDLFDFSMYMRRASRDSFCEMPLRDLGVNNSPDKTGRPISIYDVHAVNERDRYRNAAYSSCISSPDRTPPRRAPLVSALNLNSGRNAVDFSHVLAEKFDGNGNENIAAPPLITQDEFLRMFVFSESV
ncbi:hypothetical protein DFH08DRAFT_29047 [Mycena albidolilacea]|uniref:Uncharacterized protein n=1 Tax=Mycena albidolilacea TaxID=1033008 RepID=A0AAD7F4Q5_9AGAR|nr:hypothetical protein DFH08DRAFT_29047 [Mycena albidolilacea]